jgi:uncharacterized protein (DUF1501 family)
METSRRTFLRMAFGGRDARPDRDTLVVLFLRGGADGLNLVPPAGEDAYYTARPTLAIARPDDRRVQDRALDLNGFFGLHPSLAPLLPLYRDRQLAVVHAVGSEDQTRSHFEAQDLMERACPVDHDLGSGWIARLLRTLPGTRPAVSAVAIADVLPESLRGSPGASAVRSLDAFSLHLQEGERRGFVSALRAMYGGDAGDLGRAGLQVLETLETVDRLRRDAGADEGDGTLASALRQIGRLVRAEVGLEVACVDVGGWDTHFVQAGLFGDLAGGLASGLAGFWRELGDLQGRVTVVAMTEFGRRLHENVSLGTDHGRAGVMFLLGGGIAGGRVVADWPGLAAEKLDGPGDLRVTIDYRDVLAEIVAKRLGHGRLAEVFPGFSPRFRGVTR